MVKYELKEMREFSLVFKIDFKKRILTLFAFLSLMNSFKDNRSFLSLNHCPTLPGKVLAFCLKHRKSKRILDLEIFAFSRPVLFSVQS